VASLAESPLSGLTPYFYCLFKVDVQPTPH